MRFAAVILLALTATVARADLNFQFVDGADVGIEQVLVAHKQEAVSLGKSTWLWSATAWDDASGHYAYYVFHGYGTAYLFKRNADGSYTDISPTPPDDNTTLPTENRPILMDVNNDGYIDILHAGNETPKAASLLNNGDGTWTFSKAHRIERKGKVVDANGDGYLDVVTDLPDAQNWGKGLKRTAINLAGAGFGVQVEPVVLPADAPQEVVDRVNAADDRYHMPYVFYLDANTYIVTYGGGYGGEKFTYTVRNGQLIDIGLPLTGWAHEPLDVDGNGLLDVVVQYTDGAGIYRQDSSGQFVRDETGDMPFINAELAVDTVAYQWDVWAIDLDQDGDLDLVMSNKRSLRGYILDNQNGVFSLNTTIIHVDGEAIWPADVDGDGDIDVIVAGGGTTGGAARNNDQAALYINQLDPAGGGGTNPDPDPVPDPEPEPDPEPTPQAQIGAELDAAGAAIQLARGQADQGLWQSTIDALLIAIDELTQAKTIAEGEQSPNFP